MNVWKYIDSMNIVIFSKDRAAQLDLFLRSMKRFFPEFYRYQDISILYTFSNEGFGSGYVKTITLNPEFRYVYETPGNFKIDTLNLINPDKNFTMFFVDDNVFKNKFTLMSEEVKEFAIRDDIACVSLRLCPRITYCYTMNIPMQVPNFVDPVRRIWRWRDACPGDWSYPMSLDGHLFKTDDVLSLFMILDYQNPNTMEAAMSLKPLPMPFMICFKDSKIFNVPANKVQNVNNNRHGNTPAQDINERFIKGGRLSLDKLIENPLAINNTSCHQDVPIEWE